MCQSSPVGGGRGVTRVYSCKCHTFVDEITTVMTTFVYLKYINGFKIIWKYLPQKYK